MNLLSLILIIILILSIFQTIAGVGILVLGTPILLLMGFQMVEIMTLLLPISMCNSLINLILLNIDKKNIKIDWQIRNYFFLICLPGIAFGLFFLKKYSSFINFNLIVCFIIWLIIFLTYINKKKNLNFVKNFKKSIILLTGFVHGVTNSGGSILSMLITESSSNKKVNYMRYQITFFYFFLALFQYLVIVFLFYSQDVFNFKVSYFFALLSGVMLGNILSKKINEKQFKNIILFLAFLSSIFLLIKS